VARGELEEAGSSGRRFTHICRSHLQYPVVYSSIYLPWHVIQVWVFSLTLPIPSCILLDTDNGFPSSNRHCYCGRDMDRRKQIHPASTFQSTDEMNSSAAWISLRLRQFLRLTPNCNRHEPLRISQRGNRLLLDMLANRGHRPRLDVALQTCPLDF
jgi:hypothetical protein